MDERTENPQIASQARPSRVRFGAWIVWIALGWAGLAGLLGYGAKKGLAIRPALWEPTRQARFMGDIENGYAQGRRVVEAADRLARKEGRPRNWNDFFTAYLNNYSDVVDEATNGNYQLDYAPARLLVMSLWVNHLRDQTPPVLRWNNKFDTTAPLLNFNTACEAVSALAMWALLRHWRRAQHGWLIRPQWRHPWREWPAVLAGLAVWFNPAMILDAHVWPQWDVWLLPFLLLGVLAASKDRWMLAGFILMIGATLKGQVLMVMPAILLWPIFTGRPLAVLRLIIGAGLLSALVVLPWMAHSGTAKLWLCCMMIASIATAIVLTGRRRFDAAGIVTAVLAAIVSVCVMVRPDYPVMYVLGSMLIVLTALLPRWVSRRWVWPVMAAQWAIAIFAAGLAFGGQFEWFEIGYVYPQHHYPQLAQSGDNLAQLLATGPFHWRLTDDVSIGALPIVTMRTFLIWLFSISLVLCAIAAAVQAQRRSPRVLLALFTPWVMFFSLMPQMHERYLLWGAVTMCAGFGISAGSAMLAVLVTFFAFVDIAAPLFERDSNFLPGMQSITRGMSPGSAWGLLAVALICLYNAAILDRRRRMTKPVAVKEVAPVEQAQPAFDDGPSLPALAIE